MLCLVVDLAVYPPSTDVYLFSLDFSLCLSQEHLYMHLTNYSVNKHSEYYEKSSTSDTGSKRSLKFLNDYLRKKEYDIAYMWKNITDIIVKTLIVAHPHVLHAYRMCRPGQPPGGDSVCFEILGFDIMLDRKLRPWLLEVRHRLKFYFILRFTESLDIQDKTCNYFRNSHDS